MEMNEFVIAIAGIVIGVIFLIVAAGYIGNQTKSAEASAIQQDAQRLASLIEKVSNQPFSNSVEVNMTLCDISVKDGVLEVSQKGKSSSAFVPKSVQNADFKDIASVCIAKKESAVQILESCPEE
jgi:hypothetical protein